MVGCLRETSLDPVGHFLPFIESKLHFLRVKALLPGDCTEEGDDMLGEVVLNGCAVANGIYIT